MIKRTICGNRFRLMALLSFVFATTVLMAQGKKDEAVSRAAEQLRFAMISGDRAALNAIAADQLTYGHSSGVLDDKQKFVEKIASGQSDFVSIDIKDQWISVSGNTAIVRHEFHGKINDGGKPGEVHLRIMLVFKKQQGKWKLLARQAVRIT